MPDDLSASNILGAATIARVGLERVGDAPALTDLLAFQLAHARAKDAVNSRLDLDGLVAALGTPPVSVSSRAKDINEYLRRPDLGRALNPDDHAKLTPGPFDLVFIVADGLSANAINKSAAPFLKACLGECGQLRVAPIVVAHRARVAIGDEIGERLAARLSVVLIGERPGLSVADSMGIYITFAPKPGTTDAQRNCISNIHDNGLSVDEAARKTSWLVRKALSLGLTGVQLKEDADEMKLVGS